MYSVRIERISDFVSWAPRLTNYMRLIICSNSIFVHWSHILRNNTKIICMIKRIQVVSRFQCCMLHNMLLPRPPRANPREIFLAFTCRAQTKAIAAKKKQRRLTSELRQPSQKKRRTYRPEELAAWPLRLQWLPNTWQAAMFSWSQDTRPLGHIYTGYRPRKVQPVKDVGRQRKQYTIFSLNVGNGDANGINFTRVCRHMGYETHCFRGLSTRAAPRGA